MSDRPAYCDSDDCDGSSGTPARAGWRRWYAEARAEMAFRYGVRGVPVDTYKTHHSLGSSPAQAARAIYTNDPDRWERALTLRADTGPVTKEGHGKA